MKRICKLTDIDDGNARGFDIMIDDEALAIVCVRQGQQVFVYKNACPHTGVNLEWLPDQFLDDMRKYFVCATHGALFQLKNGYCVAGPCSGESLTSLEVKVEEGEIFCCIV